MTRRLLFITHGQVQIDPDVPVPNWPLSAEGRARHEVFSASAYVAGVGSVYCSAERKARDGADILAQALGLKSQIRPALHENDRSATGFLPPAEFERVADAFFAEPERSVRGWERAADAQARVLACCQEIVAQAPTGDIAIVAHGGVGALTLCAVMGVGIARTHDQPGQGGGNLFAVSLPDWSLIHGWRSIEHPTAELA